MTRKAKTSRAPRNKWAKLRAALRSISFRWEPRDEALKLNRVPYEGENKRRRWTYICDVCEGEFDAKQIDVDHLIPCGSLKDRGDLAGFVQRMFCEADGFRVLCKPCHKTVTAEERKKR